MEAIVSRRLKSEQPVYWTVPPNSYLKKVTYVLSCYEKEFGAKAGALSFFRNLATDLGKESYAPEKDLESKMKVQLVVWMLEPELQEER